MDRLNLTKEDLVTQLMHTQNNYILGLGALSLFSYEDSYPLLQSHQAMFGDYTVTFDQVVHLLENQQDRDIVLGEFLKMLIRSLVNESFEHIKDYCQRTDQFHALKSQHWYEFARLIRNFLSHNSRFEFTKYDKDLLPVQWRDKKITRDMDKSTPGFEFFGEVETWELFSDFQDFVHHQLK